MGKARWRGRNLSERQERMVVEVKSLEPQRLDHYLWRALAWKSRSRTQEIIRGGRVKAYAVMARTRWSAAPDLPTVDEAGVPGVHISMWTGMWAPKGTPRAIVEKLNAAMAEVLADEAVRKRIAEIGSEMPPSDQKSPEALAAHHKAEADRWWPIIKGASIKAE